MARTPPDLSMSQRSCTNDVFYKIWTYEPTNTQSQTSLHTIKLVGIFKKYFVFSLNQKEYLSVFIHSTKIYRCLVLVVWLLEVD